MKKVIGLAAIFCLAFSFNAHAAKDLWEMAKSPKYGEKAGGMIGRGLINAASSPIDMFASAAKGGRESSNQFVGAVGGFAKGAVCTITRAASGVIDVATFWVPQWNGVAPCRSYEDCFACTGEASGTESAAPVYQSTPSAPAPIAVRSESYQPPQQQEERMKYVKK